MIDREVVAFHKDTYVVDGHCDTAYLLGKKEYTFAKRNIIGHVDLPRLAKGGVNLQFFALYQEPEFKPVGALKRTLTLLNRVRKEISLNKSRISLVRDYQDIEMAYAQGKIAALLSIEGGDALEGEPEMLEVFYDLGVRALGLTWNNRNALADGVGEEGSKGGLTRLGKQVITMCEDKNILIDLAHISSKGFKDVINLTEKPVVVSHGNCRALCPHPRNLTDDQLRLIRDKNGVVGITLYPPFIREGTATFEDLLNHFVYMADLIGVAHVGLGSDFDGITTTLTPLDDVGYLPRLTEGLLKKGFGREDVKSMLGENFLRVLKEII